jgi:ABC-type transport system substrate-binding protein
VAQDGLTYTFKIRKGVKFHNKPPVNGRELTPEDVRWSIARNSGFDLPQGKIAQMGSFFKTLKGIEVKGDTVVITLKQKDVNLLRNLMYEYLVILPKEGADAKGDFEKVENLIGSGPFMPTLITNIGVNKFEKNPNYWESGKPHLDALTLLAGADAATTTAAFKSKQLDHLQTGYSSAKAFFGQNDIRFYNSLGSAVGTGGYFMNMTKKPFDNVKVRQAFNLAIDRHQIIATAGGPQAAYYFGFLGAWQPWMWSQDKWNTMPGYAKSGPDKDKEIEDAKKLLTEAGYPNGFTFKCECGGGAGDEAVLQMLKKVGINMVVDTNASSQNLNEYASYMKDKEVGATSKGGGHTPDFALIGQFLCDGISNMSSICDQQIEDLHKQQIAEFDQKKRIELFDKIQQRLFDLMPSAPTTRGSNFQMSYKYHRGWRNRMYESGPSNGWDAANWWLDK